MISGGYESYNRHQDKNILYVSAGNASDIRNYQAKVIDDIEFLSGPSFGMLTIVNSSNFYFEEKDLKGTVIDFYYKGNEYKEEGRRKEVIIALIVLICSLLFLCYFIYSWLSCYLKKPRISKEDEENQKVGYAMQPIGGNL